MVRRVVVSDDDSDIEFPDLKDLLKAVPKIKAEPRVQQKCALVEVAQNVKITSVDVKVEGEEEEIQSLAGVKRETFYETSRVVKVEQTDPVPEVRPEADVRAIIREPTAARNNTVLPLQGHEKSQAVSAENDLARRRRQLKTKVVYDSEDSENDSLPPPEVELPNKQLQKTPPKSRARVPVPESANKSSMPRLSRRTSPRKVGQWRLILHSESESPSESENDDEDGVYILVDKFADTSFSVPLPIEEPTLDVGRSTPKRRVQKRLIQYREEESEDREYSELEIQSDEDAEEEVEVIDDSLPSPTKTSAPMPAPRRLSVISNTSDAFPDAGAILTFEPSKSPRKRPPLRPISAFAPPSSNSVGAPSSGPIVPATPRSPRRIIPLSPHKSPDEAFWNQGEHATWVEKHSPKKPQIDTLLSRPSSPTKSPVKNNTTAGRKAKKDFLARRDEIAMNFIREIDDTTTAGRATWKKTVQTNIVSGIAEKTDIHRANIELSPKVIDSEERLHTTIAHEMCHIATWIITGGKQPSHGAAFKSWGAKVMAAFPDVEVSTTHTFEITYKYRWTCQNVACAYEYGRQSKTIDPTKTCCGRCGSRLEQTHPVPRAGGGGGNAFSQFVKENFARVKSANPGSPHKDLMGIVSKEWKALKEGKENMVSPTSEDIFGLDDALEKLQLA
ncbi:hypothetical protein G7K_6643-t1 [Saitoella complicata NRRL Y-17804]|uniref:SprT-like domain-containing protein n=1 Tax=Saitoella complicata (strain BCRC 22490 / CBS 7301 / JCM 7358 / NBRC 10748 / NRRL Y-17804) TaxID=698492 RepID=A0A0E9NT33_SAICN|nr:hypothetical protein G7K_6643-t1 [Saitoella complicata NRRL Y-17804]